MGTNLGSNLKETIGEMMVIDSTIMTTCMSSFSNHLLDLDSMSKFATLTNTHFCKYYSCMFI
jgi:hypothetical protein